MPPGKFPLTGEVERRVKQIRKQMTLDSFIDKNKVALASYIKRRVAPDFVVDQREIELWIANDEGLYNWARSSGVEFD